jgi:membrane-bound serine protease (ClpP class)
MNVRRQRLRIRNRLAASGALLLVGVLLLVAGRQQPTAAPAASGEVRLLEIDGVINPFTARYLERELARAQREGATLVVLRLDTPGGLESSTRRMVEALLGSEVPVVVHVAPPGAHAASAGMFITIAGHVAAMAPGTNIGAAHPVGVGAGNGEQVAVAKVVSDVAAFARAIATARGRNAEWAERAVRESESLAAEEALQLNVIDLIATDLEQLLGAVEGMEVTTTAGVITVSAAGLPQQERHMNFAERILHVITDPNIAYILMTIGVIGLIAELYNPGTFIPGIIGVIALIMAFLAFGSLPVSWAGVLLLLLAIGLFVAELNSEGIGFLAAAGMIAFVLAGLLFYRPITPVSPALPEAQVSWWVVVFMAAVFSGFFLIVLRAALRARREPVVTGVPALVGRTGTAVSALAPHGQVRVDGETWSAEAVDGQIASGEVVIVLGVEGVRLQVTRH